MTTKSQSIPDIHNPADVERFVQAFYVRVRSDPVLGEMFDEIAKVDWESHLPTMYQFWNKVLFGLPYYNGNPIVAHTKFNRQMNRLKGVSVQPQDFDRWLTLFNETIDELFAGRKADGAKLAAARIAGHLSAVLSAANDPRSAAANSLSQGRTRMDGAVGAARLNEAPSYK